MTVTGFSITAYARLDSAAAAVIVVKKRQIVARMTADRSVLLCRTQGVRNPKIRVSKSALADKKAIETSFMTSI
jgi:hypothetical protein